MWDTVYKVHTITLDLFETEVRAYPFQNSVSVYTLVIPFVAAHCLSLFV